MYVKASLMKLTKVEQDSVDGNLKPGELLIKSEARGEF